jgi:tellurite resistance protein TehA-like permease
VNGRWFERALRLAAVAALAALALMVWGVLDPRPISLVVAMSVGQGLGTLSFVVFCAVVFFDLRRARIFSMSPRPPSAEPPPHDESR